MTDGLGKKLRRWRVPNIIASDLLGFRARPLWQNQECREARQDSRVDRADAASSDTFIRSSVHCALLQRELLAIATLVRTTFRFWLRIAPHTVRSVHVKLHMHMIPRWKQLSKCRLYAVRYTLYSNRLKSCQHFKLHCFHYLHHGALALCWRILIYLGYGYGMPKCP